MGGGDEGGRRSREEIIALMGIGIGCTSYCAYSSSPRPPLPSFLALGLLCCQSVRHSKSGLAAAATLASATTAAPLPLPQHYKGTTRTLWRPIENQNQTNWKERRRRMARIMGSLSWNFPTFRTRPSSHVCGGRSRNWSLSGLFYKEPWNVDG